MQQSIEPVFEVLSAYPSCDHSDERGWTYIRKDGSRFPVLLSVTAHRVNGADISSRPLPVTEFDE